MREGKKLDYKITDELKVRAERNSLNST